MLFGVLGLREAAGRFDDDLRADAGPIDLGRVLGGENFDLFAADDDGVAPHFDVRVQTAEGRVVLEQVSDGGRIREVVRGDKLYVGVVQPGSDHISTNAAEAVDSYLDGHIPLV